MLPSVIGEPGGYLGFMMGRLCIVSTRRKRGQDLGADLTWMSLVWMLRYHLLALKGPRAA
jgi:hypothetical protein